MKPRYWSSLLLVLALTAALPAMVSAQSLNKHAIKAQLQHKTLLLRGHYVCPTAQPCTLKFDQQGKLRNKAAVAPFSLGAVYVDSLKFKRNKLELLAEAATILRLSKSGPPKFRTLILKPQKLQIQIAFDASQPSGLQTALHAVFAGTIEEALKAETPQQRKLDLYSLPLLEPVTQEEADPELAEVGWPPQKTLVQLHGIVVTSPKPLHTATPQYTDKAKSNKVQGKCELYLVVNAQGFPQNIRILKSLPDGLDEQAIAALSQFRLKPATQNGKPAAVRMAITETFRLH